MGATAKRTVAPRRTLSRERVMRTAVALADEEGLEALTMRRLGQELGVEAMSLYNHVDNKEDLLDGMVDLVYDEIELPEGVGWKIAMRTQAVTGRAALIRHRWALALMESRMTPGPANLRHHDSVIRILRDEGFSIDAAIHAFSAIDSYVYGFALQEVTLPFETSEELREVAQTILQQFPVGEYPHLAEVVQMYVAKPDYRYADEFEFGLDLILDGLDRTRRGRPAGRPRR